MADLKGVFTTIFSERKWGANTTPSGPGSTLTATQLIRAALPALFAEFGIRSLVDAPCGDGAWVLEISRGLDSYVGVDIVEELVALNRARDLPASHTFRLGDVTEDVLPRADAILCRDCLVHLPLELAVRALQRFKQSGSTYLMTTTFPDRDRNPQSGPGGWRPLNLTLAPFALPPPLKLLRERPVNPDDKYNDKMLGVWRLDDIAL